MRRYCITEFQFTLAAVVCGLSFLAAAQSTVVADQAGRGVWITDRTGARWDLEQAVSLGFDPKKFQYGLGKDAFVPLDDSHLTQQTADVPPNLRVIGVVENGEARAHSVPKLSRHEIANSTIDSKAIAVGY